MRKLPGPTFRPAPERSNSPMHYDKSLPRDHVKSEAVRSIGYDEGEWVLQVRFNNGKLYNYFRVPPHEFHSLRSAESIGAYLNREIKPYYECEEAETEASAH
jgi:hypothetical protein